MKSSPIIVLLCLTSAAGCVAPEVERAIAESKANQQRRAVEDAQRAERMAQWRREMEALMPVLAERAARDPRFHAEVMDQFDRWRADQQTRELIQSLPD